jgi:transcriptional regulator with XRE-family HTH domain
MFRYILPTGLRSHTEMLDQIIPLEESEIALPSSSLDLSTRMRDLRARQGLKQSEVARRMRLDPSIPSLWEQGKRLVPASRVRALAEALEVTVEELLDGVTPARRSPTRTVIDEAGHTALADLIDERAVRPQAMDNVPLLRLLPQSPDSPPQEHTNGDVVADQWVVPERPPLEGWIPEGWQPADRIQDITPSLPDGYWLDPVKLERNNARLLLKSRLCADDRLTVGDREVPGAALAERLYVHCCHADGFVTGGRLPLAEAIFRCVISADHGGLTDAALVEMLRDRTAAVPVSTTLLRRLRDSVRPYPIRRVDADLFGGRR